ncbi:MAG: hypothetical protein NZ869_06560 [Thermoanaerobaculum sp.]|nr:hypothetical protein [Thermoanaerobaculum sp.]MDW7966509.1 hypothetical protein [Thermoanaerobaculum sp.]
MSVAGILALLAVAAMLALGFWAGRVDRRHGGDSEGFWTAHRSLSGWSLGMSLSASMLSVSWSLVFGVELLYRYGWGGLWLLAVPWLITLALFCWLAPRLRGFGAFSQGELFARIYGRDLQRLTVAVLSLVFLAWCGAEIAAAGQLLAPALKVPAWAIMVALAALVAAYSWVGGFRAVVWTDVAQFLLIAGFLLFLGWRAWPAAANLAPLGQMPGPSPLLVAITLVAYITGWLAEADIWLRLTAAKSHAHARLALALTMLVSLIWVVALPAVLAAACRALFPAPGKSPVLAALMARLLPEQLNLLWTGGLAAVALSTISTTANVVAVSWARDWPRAAEKSMSLAWARWTSALAVVAALGVAFVARSLAELFYLTAGLLSAGLFWPTLGLWNAKWRPAARRASGIGLGAVLVSFTLERTGLWQFTEEPGLLELGIGYIPPALAVGALTFLVGLGWGGLPRTKG